MKTINSVIILLLVLFLVPYVVSAEQFRVTTPYPNANVVTNPNGITVTISGLVPGDIYNVEGKAKIQEQTALFGWSYVSYGMENSTYYYIPGMIIPISLPNLTVNQEGNLVLYLKGDMWETININKVYSIPTKSMVYPVEKWRFENNFVGERGNYSGINYGVTFINGNNGTGINIIGTQYVNMGSIPSTEKGSMMGWIKPSGDYTSNQAVMSGFDSVGHDYSGRYNILMKSGDCVNGDWSTVIGNGITYQTVCSTQTFNSANFPSNVWTHVAITYDGKMVKFYKNGVLVNSITQSVSGVGDAQPYSIGRLGGYSTYYFRGGIDEASIWNVNLTQEEIVEEMSESSLIIPTPTITPVITPIPRLGVYLDVNKTLVLNGVKTFPVDIMQLCQAGTQDNIESCDVSASKMSGKFTSTTETLIYDYIQDKISIFENNNLWYSVSQEQRGYFTKTPHFLYWSNHPNEPTTIKDLNYTRSVYNEIKTQYPDDLVFMANFAWRPDSAAPSTITADQICDVFGFDPFRNKEMSYPISDQIFAEERVFTGDLFGNMNSYTTLEEVPIPVWGYIMSSKANWNEGSTVWKTYDAQRLRGVAYFKIVAGVKGLMFWPYKNYIVPNAGFVGDEVDTVMYQNLASELSDPIIQAIITKEATHSSWRKEKPWDNFVTFSNNPTKTGGYYGTRDSLAYRYYPSGYLIVVNKNPGAISTNINVQGMGTKNVNTIGHTNTGARIQSFSMINGQFNDTFNGHEAKIYKIE